MAGAGSHEDRFVTGVEISVFSHATEDEDKVERALRNMIPQEVSNIKVDMRRLRGYYNDPITIMTASIRRRKGATETFLATMRALSTLDRYRLIEEIEERVDKAGNLYLRLDKQRALGGVEVLNEVDPVRIIFRFQVPHGADPVSFIRSSIDAVVGESEESTAHNG
jgi:RNA binding exosome subunit